MDASQIVIDKAAACPSTGLSTRGDGVRDELILAELEARSKCVAHWAFGSFFEKAGGCALKVIGSKEYEQRVRMGRNGNGAKGDPG